MGVTKEFYNSNAEIFRKLNMICQVFLAFRLLHFQEVKTVHPCALKMWFFYSHPIHIWFLQWKDRVMYGSDSCQNKVDLLVLKPLEGFKWKDKRVMLQFWLTGVVGMSRGVHLCSYLESAPSLGQSGVTAACFHTSAFTPDKNGQAHTWRNVSFLWHQTRP